MLLIALLHNVKGVMKIYSTRRQLKHLTHTQLKDMAIAPQAASTEAKKASLWGLIKDVIERSIKRKEL